MASSAAERDVHRYASFVIDSAAGTTNRHYAKTIVIVVTTTAILVTFISRVEKRRGLWFWFFDNTVCQRLVCISCVVSKLKYRRGSDVAGPDHRRFLRRLLLSAWRILVRRRVPENLLHSRKRRRTRRRRKRGARGLFLSLSSSHPRRIVVLNFLITATTKICFYFCLFFFLLFSAIEIVDVGKISTPLVVPLLFLGEIRRHIVVVVVLVVLVVMRCPI